MHRYWDVPEIDATWSRRHGAPRAWMSGRGWHHGGYCWCHEGFPPHPLHHIAAAAAQAPDPGDRVGMRTEIKR